MTKSRLHILSLFLLLATQSTLADVDEDGHYWLAITGQGSFGALDPALEKLRWWMEGQGRFMDDGNHFFQGLVRTALGYSVFDNAAVWLGYGWIPTIPPGGERFDEHRIWQQFTWSTNTEYGNLSTRTRLEQRFVETGSDVGWRFRQMVKFVYPLAFQPKLSLVGYDEIFVNINSANWGAAGGFDRNRFFAGLGWNFDRQRRIRTELGYQNQFTNAPAGNDRVDHTLLLNVLLNY